MRMIGTSARRRVNRLVWLLPLILILPLLIGVVETARAAVTLVSFTATGMDGYILVEWETATELDNAGFFVQASDQQYGTYSRISEFIFTESDGLTGATYPYPDYDVTPGVVKWYKLESVSNSQISELTGPISAIEGVATANVTSTPTATSTLTLTPTETESNQATPTNTSTSTPTATETANSAYPGPVAATATSAYPGIATTVAPVGGQSTTAAPPATATPRSSANQNAAPTSPALSGTIEPQDRGLDISDNNLEGTLVPLPDITIQFGEDSTSTAVSYVGTTPGLTQEGARVVTSTRWSRYGTLGFILLIWALLGGWFWFSFRKLD